MKIITVAFRLIQCLIIAGILSFPALSDHITNATLMCIGLYNKRLCEDRADRFQNSWKVSLQWRRAFAMIHANWHLLFEVPFSGEPLNGYFSYNLSDVTQHTLSCYDKVLTLWLSVYRYVTLLCAEVCGVACARPQGDDKAYHESLATTAKLNYDNKKCKPLRSSETKHKAHTPTFSSILTSGPVFSLFRWVFFIYFNFHWASYEALRWWFTMISVNPMTIDD